MNHIENHAPSTTGDKCDRCGRLPPEPGVSRIFRCQCDYSVACWTAHRTARILVAAGEQRGIFTCADYTEHMSLVQKLADAMEPIVRELREQQAVRERVEVDV